MPGKKKELLDLLIHLPFSSAAGLCISWHSTYLQVLLSSNFIHMKLSFHAYLFIYFFVNSNRLAPSHHIVIAKIFEYILVQ